MNDAALRWVLGATGAFAGLAFFLLIDEAALAGAPPSLHRFVVFFALAAFPAFGLMAGPLAAPQAAQRAALLAVAAAALVTLAGTRFSGVQPEDILEPTGKGLFILPFIALAAALTPFAICADTKGGWRAYAPLFKAAWQSGIKALIALLFLGLFWAVYFLSTQLLELVGVDILEDLINIDPVPYILSGATLGIALAVACDLESVIATLLSLVLRLFSLLLVPVAAVVVLFVLAALLQGLDEVFAQRSAAATMLAMAAGATLLVIATLGTTEEKPLHAATQWSIRALGILLPMMAAIALYAIWLRIAQYGWTPERVLAAITALIACLFILPTTAFGVYAAPGWQARTRQGFVWSAIAAVLLGALWFTPLLNAQRISAQSQLARLLDGSIDARTYSFWPLAHEWGHAGEDALTAYRAAGLEADIENQIAAAEDASSQYGANTGIAAAKGRIIWESLRERIETIPPNTSLPTADSLGDTTLNRLQRLGFDRVITIAGLDEPLRAIAIKGDFDLENPAEEWMIITQAEPRQSPRAFLLEESGQTWRFGNIWNHDWIPGTDVIETLRTEPFDLVRPPFQGIKAGGFTFIPQQ